MMRDPIQLSAPLRSVELFSGIQGGHINFQLESIAPFLGDDIWKYLQTRKYFLFFSIIELLP